MSNNDIAPEEIPGCTQALLDALVPEEDLRVYARIEARIQEDEQQYLQHIEEAHGQIKLLSQMLAQLRATSTREAANWKSANQHRSEMEQIQAQQVEIDSQNSETEMQLQAIQDELEQLRNKIEGMEDGGDDDQEGMDKDAIAVGLFRKMGFVPSYPKSGTNEASALFESLLVRSDSKNRSVLFDVNDEVMKAEAVTPYILANQIWAASE